MSSCSSWMLASGPTAGVPGPRGCSAPDSCDESWLISSPIEASDVSFASVFIAPGYPHTRLPHPAGAVGGIGLCTAPVHSTAGGAHPARGPFVAVGAPTVGACEQNFPPSDYIDVSVLIRTPIQTPTPAAGSPSQTRTQRTGTRIPCCRG